MRGSTMLTGLIARRTLDKLDQSSHGDAGWAFRAIGLGVIGPGGAGDVQMRPGNAIGKLFEKGGRGNRAGFFAADVLDVGNVRLDLARVFFIERQLPKLFANFFAGSDDPVNQRLVGPENSGVNVAEGDRNRAGERRHVDDARSA